MSLERSLKLTRIGLLSVTGEDLTIKNGHPTRFPHVEGIRKAGFFGNLVFAIIARMLCGNHLNHVETDEYPVQMLLQIYGKSHRSLEDS